MLPVKNYKPNDDYKTRPLKMLPAKDYKTFLVVPGLQDQASLEGF